MSVHEWQKTFKIDGENGPWVGKRQIGECEVEERIKAGVSGCSACISMARSMWAKAFWTAVERGTSISGRASWRSSSSSGMGMTDGAERCASRAYLHECPVGQPRLCP